MPCRGAPLSPRHGPQPGVADTLTRGPGQPAGLRAGNDKAAGSSTSAPSALACGNLLVAQPLRDAKVMINWRALGQAGGGNVACCGSMQSGDRTPGAY